MNAITLRQDQGQPRASAMSFPEIVQLAAGVAKSGLFGLKTPEQALALMMISQAEGRHPALAARDYDIISGRPAKKAEAMLRDFFEAGGKVEWHALCDTIADATFSHPAGGSARITWDMEWARTAQLFGNNMYKKYPRQMLRSRCVSEGVRTIYPAATSGMYVPEEVSDFASTPSTTAPPPSPPAPPPAPRLSGEIGPLAVPTKGGKSQWVTWGTLLISGFKAARSREELTALMKANGTTLESCEKAAPRAHHSIVAAYDKIIAEMAQPPAPPPVPPSAPQARSEAETTAEQERALDRAAQAGDPQDQLATWLAEKIDEAAVAGSLEILNEIDSEVCATLDTANRDDQRTRWNIAYGARRAILTKGGKR